MYELFSTCGHVAKHVLGNSSTKETFENNLHKATVLEVSNDNMLNDQVQDLVNSRHQNMGFKILSSSSNNPFSTILLDFKNPNEKVVLEVVYVYN